MPGRARLDALGTLHYTTRLISTIFGGRWLDPISWGLVAGAVFMSWQGARVG